MGGPLIGDALAPDGDVVAMVAAGGSLYVLEANGGQLLQVTTDEKPEEAVQTLQEKNYQQVPLADLKEQIGAQRTFPSKEWAKMFQDGTVTGWLQQVTDFYVSVGGIDNPVPAEEYFVPDLYVEVAGA